MSEFIGRTGSKRSYSYPVTPRSAGASGSNFARNYASGPFEDTDVPIAGVQVPWSIIDSGVIVGDDVPITPLVTGQILISAAIALENISSDPVNIQAEVQVNDVTVATPADVKSLIDAAVAEGVSTLMIPVVARITLPVGVLANIQIRVSASDEPGDLVHLVAASSTMNIQEVSVATG